MSKPYKKTFDPLWLPPRPDGPSRVLTQLQRDTMSGMLSVENVQPTGYERVPIEVLREDPTIHLLLDMLETCRPAGSASELDYINKYLTPLEPAVDGYGNRLVMVPIPEGHPKIMWSSHTDTVHTHDGQQTVETTHGMAWTSNGSCLGADDTVGNWLMIEMIKAKVPGLYVFHREEECGGGGSMWLAENAREMLGEYDCAIALDRAYYADVITHQAGGRCCSDAFASSIAGLIGGSFKPCTTGVFTDTANYIDVIGECTNLSVGYFKQHGPMEHTNLAFASRLRDRLIAADWSKLVFERKPGEVDDDWSWYDDKYGSYTAPRGKRAGMSDEEETLMEMEGYVQDYAWIVAEYLTAHGVTIADLEDFIPGENR